MKIKRAFALLLVLAMVFTLCACGAKGPKGRYIAAFEGSDLLVLEFSGKNVTLSVIGDTDGPAHGTFTQDGNTVTCSFDDGTGDEFTYDPDADTLDWMGMLTFEKR